MASTEQVPGVERLGALTPAALAMLQDLVVRSHWNQTPADWDVFASQGAVLVVRDGQGRIVASGAVLPMGESEEGGSVAWISMILVTPAERGRGLGRLVFEACLREALAGGHIPMLDATPQGEPLYRQFGFEPLWKLTRWRREAHAGTVAPAGASAAPTASVLDLDAQALGFTRPDVLAALLARPDSVCLREPEAIGLLRSGRVAHHIGPLLAAGDEAGAALLVRLATSVAGPVLVDVPDARTAMSDVLEAQGFTRQRGFTRMALPQPGRNLPLGRPPSIHAIAGPEFA